MIRFTGTLSFENLQKYALDNSCNVSKERGAIKYSIYDKISKDVNGCKNLKEAKQILEGFIKGRQTPSQITEVIECDDIVKTLSTVKDDLPFHAAHKDTHKLLIIANNNRVMVVTDNGKEYAIAITEYAINLDFKIVLPLERSHGFCKVLEVLKKQGKLDDIVYSLEDNRLIAKFDGSKFEFITLSVDEFSISNDLQTILDEFMADKVSDTNDVIEAYNKSIEDKYNHDNQEKSRGHICFSGQHEYFFYEDEVFKSHLSSVIGNNSGYRLGRDLLGKGNNILSWHQQLVLSGKVSYYPNSLIDFLYPLVYTGQVCELPEVKEVKTEDIKVIEPVEPVEAVEPVEVIEDTQTETSTINVAGVGDIDLIPVDSLAIGMYLSYDALLYTIADIEQVNFVNNQASYIVTVYTLLNASEPQKLLLSNDQMLAAWHVSFEAPSKSNKQASKQVANKVAKRDIKPVDSVDIELPVGDDLPKPVRPATHNRGIKNNGRQMYLKMLSEGATIEQIMKSFNWSKKTASNHITYARQWGYEVELNDGIYRAV